MLPFRSSPFWTAIANGSNRKSEHRCAEVRREHAFANRAVKADDLLAISEADDDDDLRENPFVKDEPHAHFFAGLPLVDSDGLALGALYILDSRGHKLTEHQRHMLKVLANETMMLLELRREIRESRKNWHKPKRAWIGRRLSTRASNANFSKARTPTCRCPTHHAPRQLGMGPPHQSHHMVGRVVSDLRRKAARIRSDLRSLSPLTCTSMIATRPTRPSNKRWRLTGNS